MRKHTIAKRMILGLLATGLSTSLISAKDTYLLAKDADYPDNGITLRNNEFFTHWTNHKGNLEWTFSVDEDGEYYIYLEARPGNWRGGPTFDILVDGKKVQRYKIKKSKGVALNKVSGKKALKLSKGEHTLTIKVHKKIGNRVADIRNAVVTKRKAAKQIVDTAPLYKKKVTFAETLSTLYSDHSKELSFHLAGAAVQQHLWDDFPQEMNWLSQDMIERKKANKKPKLRKDTIVNPFFKTGRKPAIEKEMINRVLAELSDSEAAPFKEQLNAINLKPGSLDALKLYVDACKVRRLSRLKPLLAKTESIIFAKHQVFASNTGIYNTTEMEGLNKGEVSSLNVIDLKPEKDGTFAPTSVLFDPGKGMVRDPELSHDAKRLLFAKREISLHRNKNVAPDTGNYQIYEMDLATKKTRQLTTDETYGANYEPCYLPNGDIMFNSSRIVQHITCGWGDHSNLFMMNKDGKYQRQIGFDQVSTQFPVLLNDGRVVYLRRDYNDRGQSAAHALFAMNADGTGQTEYYGNQTGTPNSFMHPRAIPGSTKIACVLSGYHTRQGGQLAIIDVRKGRNNGEGVVQIPQGTKPQSKPSYDDGYAKDQIQYSNPFPLSETEFIVSRSDTWCANKTGGGVDEHYSIVYMTADGRSELLSRDPTTSSLQALPVMKRKKVQQRPSLVDYTRKTGTYYIQNAYLGDAVKGLKPDQKIKKVRVIEILYKAATMKSGSARGPGGGNDTVTTPAHPLALFDAKKIIGEATVYEDGSAMFEVPARTPVYFQLLDEKNRMVQTMRSWSTLMPGEKFSCVGCHEDKNNPPVGGAKKTIAMTKGVEKLKSFYGHDRGFSFLQDIQPIFDKHCTDCHQDGKKAGKKLTLTAEPFVDAPSQWRRWAQSYVQLMAARPGPNPRRYSVANGPKEWRRKGKARKDEPNKYVMYHSRLNQMAFKPPYFAGAIKSGMIKLLEKGHKDVELSQEEWDKLVAWIDLSCQYSSDYIEGHLWTDENLEMYLGRLKERKRNQDIDAKNVKEYIKDGQM